MISHGIGLEESGDRGLVPFSQTVSLWHDPRAVCHAYERISIVFSPQAWPFLRSSSVQVIGFQSGRQDQPRAGIGDLDAVAARLVDIEEEGLLDRVLVRAGLDEDAVLQEDVGGAQDLLATVERIGQVVKAPRVLVWSRV